MQSDAILYATALQSPAWLIAEPLEPAVVSQIADFNRRGIRWLLGTLRAAGADPASAGKWPRAIAELAALWLALDEDSVARLAAMPYLLFELGLDDASATRLGPLGAAVNMGAPNDLASMILHYAWHIARANPLAAASGLGLSADAAGRLRELGFGELEALVPQIAARLGLRWSGRVPVWQQLLAAVSTGASDALQRERLNGLRRLAGDLLLQPALPRR